MSPEANALPVKSVEEEPPRVTIPLVQEGFTSAKTRARRRPTARGATLGDFLSKNSFQAVGGEGAQRRPNDDDDDDDARRHWADTGQPACRETRLSPYDLTKQCPKGSHP